MYYTYILHIFAYVYIFVYVYIHTITFVATTVVDGGGELRPLLSQVLGVSWPRQRRHHQLNDKGMLSIPGKPTWQRTIPSFTDI